MARAVIWLAAAVLLALVAVAVAMRMVPSPPGDWHVDPSTLETHDRRNAHLLTTADAPVYGLPATELALALDAVARATPRTNRIAGAPEDLWTTYVVRSRIMGFPDYVSVRIAGLDDATATLAIYARARFGRSDLGVNRARVENWLAALRHFER